ncbi:unnamed protein product [Sphenostylis stenocarpa]|uniref:Uncharacterized protein n=1 Tax=Sphenostylis stenocarpa TaxID=92480 RepID=A0AA86V8Z5_9FABA|nr:unnamed protein product [Sphenostylis stenocarpa]
MDTNIYAVCQYEKFYEIDEGNDSINYVFIQKDKYREEEQLHVEVLDKKAEIIKARVS